MASKYRYIWSRLYAPGAIGRGSGAVCQLRTLYIAEGHKHLVVCGSMLLVAIHEYDKAIQDSSASVSSLERIREAGLLVCMSYVAMSIFAVLAFMHHLNFVAATAPGAMAWHKGAVARKHDILNAENLLFVPYIFAICAFVILMACEIALYFVPSIACGLDSSLDSSAQVMPTVQMTATAFIVLGATLGLLAYRSFVSIGEVNPRRTYRRGSNTGN